MLIESAVLGEQLGTLFEEATALDQSFQVELTEPGNENAPLVWAGKEDDKLVRYSSELVAAHRLRFAWRAGAGRAALTAFASSALRQADAALLSAIETNRYAK